MADLLPPMVVTLTAVISDFTDKMKIAKTEMDDVAKKGESSFGQLAAFGKQSLAGVAIATVAIGTVSLIAASQFEDAHARMVTAIKDTGGNFDTLAPHIQAAEQHFEKLGFTNAEYEGALGKLTISLGNAGKAVADMGILADVARVRHTNLAESAIFVAKAAEGQTLAMRRMGIDVTLTGDKAQKAAELMKILNDRFGGQAAAEADTFGGKMRTLHATLTDLATKIGEVLIPIIESLATRITNVVTWFEKHKVAAEALAVVVGGPLVIAMSAYIAKQTVAFAEGVISTVRGIAGAITGFLLPATDAEAASLTVAATAESILTFGLAAAAGAAAIAATGLLVHASAGDSAAASANGVAAAVGTETGAIDANTGALNANDVATSHVLKSADDLISVIDREIGAHNTFTKAKEAVTTATQAHTKAEEALADLIAKGPVDLAKVQAATDALTSATDTATRATTGLADAQKKLDDLLKPQDPQSVAEATNKLADARDRVAAAGDNIATREHELQAAIREGNPDKILAAQHNLTAATDGLNDANANVVDSTKALNDEQRPTIGTQDQIAAARDNVTTKTDELDRAQRAVTTSQGALSAAQAGDPEFQGKVSDARDLVATKTQAISDAQDNVTRTGIAFHTSLDTMNADIAANPGLIQAARDQLANWAADDPAIRSPLLNMMIGKLKPPVITVQIQPISLAPLAQGPPVGAGAGGLTSHPFIEAGSGQVAEPKAGSGSGFDIIFAGSAAEGAIVKARPGGTPIIAGEAGQDEAVVPLPDLGNIVLPAGGGGGGGVAIHVGEMHFHETSSAADTAREVREELLRMGRSLTGVGLA